jgi:hypothetical protein
MFVGIGSGALVNVGVVFLLLSNIKNCGELATDPVEKVFLKSD